MKITYLKKSIALILALMLLFSITQVTAFSQENGVDIVAHYDMSHTDGYLTDVSGNGNDASLYNISDDDFNNVLGKNYLELPGTEQSYAALPLSIADGLNYKEGFSVEIVLKPRSARFQFLWTIGTGHQTDYLFMNPRLSNGRMNVAIKTGSTENAIGNIGNVTLSTTEFSILTVTSEGSNLKAYVNGEYIGQLNHSHDLDNLFKGDGESVLGWLAKSNWPADAYCDAVISDFKIYSKTLSQNEVSSNHNYMLEEQALIEATANIPSKLPYGVNSIELPSATSRGTAINWTSSDESIIDNSGNLVTRPAGNTTVTLTAAVSAGSGVTVTKEYDVFVVADNDEIRAQMAADEFDLGISYITDDITLLNEVDGVEIQWEGNEYINENGEVILRPDTDTEVKFKAIFKLNDVMVEKEYTATIAAKVAGYLATYIALYEPDMGMEFAEFPSGKYTDNTRTDVMYYGISHDGTSFEGLNNNKPVLYPLNFYKMGSPSLFRRPDGTYGAIASVDNNSSEILVYSSDDLIFFDNQKLCALNKSNIKVKNPAVKYDNGTKLYNVFWEGDDGNSYVNTTSDFKSFSDAVVCDYNKEALEGTFPVYASVSEASAFEITAAEYDRVEKKFGKIQSVGISEIEDINATEGTKITLPEEVNVEYNDGSSKSMGVEWDLEGAGLDLDNPKSGTYEVNGTVQRSIYNSPIAECRADPYVIYNEQDGYYYFTSSYMQEDLKNPYANLIVRKAKTINGLSDAEESIIWWGSRDNNAAVPYYWAPELHYIGGKWRMISMANWKMIILTCEGGDMTNPDHWEFTGVVKSTTDGQNLGAFDTTFVEYNGQCYYVSPTGGALWITTFDADDPLTPTGPLVKISAGDMAWEFNTKTNQIIQEGSSIFINDGRIYNVYAASTVDMHYCVGMIYADLNDDLMDPSSWQKYPIPVLTSTDLTTTIKEPVLASNGNVAEEGEYSGTFGPGHNSLTIDENGNPVIVYHARDWSDSYTEGTGTAKYGLLDPGRHAYANSIHFGADGFPIFNMTAEQELAAELETVTMTVNVEGEGEIDESIVVHYDMSHEDGYLKDLTGNGHNGTMHNISDSDFINENGDDILMLPGTANSYIDLPLSIVNDMESYKDGFSVEMALVPRTAQYQFLWTIGTGNQTNYLFLNPRLSNGYPNVAIKTGGTENNIPNMRPLSTEEFSVMTVTSDGNTIRAYVNGVFIGSRTHTHNLDLLFAGDGQNILGWIAKSNWPDPYCDAVVTDFKMYNKTLTGEEISDKYASSNYTFYSNKILEAIDDIDLGDLSNLMADITLPSEGLYGTTITWETDKPDVISRDGKVTMQDSREKVILTATVTLNGVSQKKQFTAYVVGKNEAKDIIYNKLMLPYYMTEKDLLPMSMGNASISWTSDNAAIDANTGKVTQPETGMAEVNLTATITYSEDDTSTKNFRVKVMQKGSGYILSYTRQTANIDGMYSYLVCDSMHLGYSEDGESYRSLLNNTGVLFAKSVGATSKFLKAPYIFRMKDGSFGVLAVRVNDAANTADQNGTVMLYTSKDLVKYEEVGLVTLPGGHSVSDPFCSYNAYSDEYVVSWIDSKTGNGYCSTTADFKQFSDPSNLPSLKENMTDTDIDYAIESNVIPVTADEAKYILNKLEGVVNTTVDNAEIKATVGDNIDLDSTKVKANYSDGSSVDKAVDWNQSDLAAVDFSTPGTYTVKGTVRQLDDQVDNYPFLAGRADPEVIKFNGKYYFTSTTENSGNKNIYIRESDTLVGLKDAEEHLIFDAAKGTQFGYYTPQQHWAPELHEIGGELYLLFAANQNNDFDIQCMVMKLKTDGNPKSYEDWNFLTRYLNKDGGMLTDAVGYGGITLDMTHFSYNNKNYVVWAQRNFGKNGGTSDLWIGETSADKPWQLINDPVMIIPCEYGWERNGTFVNEGPFTIIRDDKLYLTYSGGATNETYCNGMATVQLSDDVDFLDPAVWEKSNYPILTSFSNQGYYGPGHNSYVMGDDGQLVNVMHGRTGTNGGGSRHTFLRNVHFGIDGEPILNMTQDREILPENKDVTMTITVSATSLLGDVDLNGQIELKDALLLQKHIVKLVTLEGQQKINADVNGDGVLSLKDVLMIQKYVAGIITSF